MVAELDQGVVVFDPRGVPRDMNPKARRLLNLPMGVPFTEADPKTLKALRQVLDTPERVADLQIRRREGTVRLRVRVLTGGNIPPDELDETSYYPGGRQRAGGAVRCWTAWCCWRT